MTLHLPTLLWTCVLMLSLSAGVMTLFGATQRVYRGFWWWTAAQWLLALGLMLQAFRDTAPALLPLACLLILQWPIVVLTGMRRFSPRNGLRLPPAADWLLLVLAYAAWLAAWASQSGVTARIAAFAAGAFMLHFYAAVLLTRLAEFRQSAALKALAGVELLVASVQALRFVAAAFGSPAWIAPENLLAAGLVVLVAALVMVYLALLLTYERTEGKLRASHRKLRLLADFDELTNVPNRRHFHDLARRTLVGAAPETAAVIMFDIDHFKQINDLLGHATGDEALRQVALAVRETLRSQDVAGRLGGDEFAVLLPETSLADAMAVASRIVGRLEHRQVAPRSAPLTLSFGVVQMQAGEALAVALRRADQALYEAKRQGRSRAVVATGREDRPVFGESRAMGLKMPC